MSDKTTEIVIEATERKPGNKGDSRKLRAAGKIPAVLNSKGKSTPIQLDPKLLPKAWTANNKKFHLSLGGTKREVLITELQLHPVKRLALHVDLTYAD